MWGPSSFFFATRRHANARRLAHRRASYYLSSEYRLEMAPDIILPGVILTVSGDLNRATCRLTGYLDWHEWAGIQHKADLNQNYG